MVNINSRQRIYALSNVIDTMDKDKETSETYAWTEWRKQMVQSRSFYLLAKDKKNRNRTTSSSLIIKLPSWTERMDGQRPFYG